MNALRLAIAMLALTAVAVHAQVTVGDAWVRGTVPGQTSTGAFMQLRSTVAVALVGVGSKVAKSAELHESSQEGGMMRMRAIERLELPAGKLIELKPGGYHLMLLDLTEPLRAGATVPLTLEFQDGAGRRTTQNVTAEVRPLAASDARR